MSFKWMSPVLTSTSNWSRSRSHTMYLPRSLLSMNLASRLVSILSMPRSTASVLYYKVRCLSFLLLPLRSPSLWVFCWGSCLCVEKIVLLVWRVEVVRCWCGAEPVTRRGNFTPTLPKIYKMATHKSWIFQFMEQFQNGGIVGEFIMKNLLSCNFVNFRNFRKCKFWS